MKTTYTLLLAFLTFGVTLAQEFPYEFSVLNEDYNELTEPIVLTESEWDDPNLVFPLGFTFYHFETPATTIYMYGEFSYGTLLSTFLEKDLTAALIVPFDADVIDANYTDSTSNSTISYQSEGIAPNRIFKIQWKDCAFYNEYSELGTSEDRVNFQVWFYEGSNILEYRFGEMNVASPELNIDSNGVLVGLVETVDFSMDTISNAWMLTEDIETPNPTNFETIEDIFSATLLEGIPTEGLVYRFASSYVSTPELSVNENILIYPKITSEQLFIEVPSRSDYEIVSISGQIVKTGNLQTTRETLFVGDLSPGVYLVKLNTKETQYVEKILIQ